MANSQVYERIFDIFCKLEKKTFENLPVADIQVYECPFEVFLNVFMQMKI